MDKLAEAQYTHDPSEFSTPIPHLNTQLISFSTPFFRITGDFKNILVKYHCDILTEKHISKNWKIDEKYMHIVNWKAIKTTFSSLDWATRSKLTKSLHRQWDTAQRKNKWSQYTSLSNQPHRCPLCHTYEEDCDHVFRCTHINMKETQKHFIHEL